MANSICERVIGTIRRDCLDWLIPLSKSHPRSILSPGLLITIAGARTWRLVLVFQIGRLAIAMLQHQIHAIAVDNRTRSVPNRFLADCITNTPLHPPVAD